MNSVTTIQFLKQNPLANFLRITEIANDSYVGKKDTYLSDIPNEDLIQYIKNLLNGREAEIWIEHRQIKGATNVKVGQSYKMNFILENPVTTPVPVQASTPAVVQSQPIQAEVMHQNNAMLGNPFGLSGERIMDHMMKASKLDDLRESYSDLKNDYTDLKKKYDILDDDNRKLKTDLSIAQREKELAILSEKMEKRSFYDSPAFEKLMEKAPGMIESVVAMKMGATGEVTAATVGLGNPNVSERKREFFEYVGESCTDDQVNYLGSIIHFISNENFMLDLKELIQKYVNNG